MKNEKLLKIGMQILGMLAGLMLAIFYSFNFIYQPNIELSSSDEKVKISREEIKGEADDEERLPEIKWKEVNILLGGDVMLSRYVGRKMAQENDFDLAWERIQGKFKKADLALVNLEAPFCSGDSYFVPDDQMIFKVDPQAIEGLIGAGIDGVSLANNHIYNQGEAGLEYTKKLLADNSINYSLGQTSYLKIKRGDKIYRIALLAYSYDLGLDEEDLKNKLSEIKEKNPDYIIVSMHAGTEYVYEPGEQQINFAHLAIDEGANLVWGHHPHVVQSQEEYNGGYIFYSLGNLIFDQNWSIPTTEGLVIEVVFEPKEKLEFKEIREYPIKIEDNFQPRWNDLDKLDQNSPN